MSTDYEIMWPHMYHHGKLLVKGEETDFEALLQVLEVGLDEIQYGSDGHSYKDREATIKIGTKVAYEVRDVIRQLKELNAFVGA